MSKAIEQLRALHSLAQSSDDDDFKMTNEVSFKMVSVEEIEAAEERLGFSLPPSYKHFLVEFGTFRIGSKIDCEHLCFHLVDIGEVGTVHQRLEEDYEAESSAEIADNMGVEEGHVAATKNGVVFAMEGFEDYWTFDQRSREGTGECKVVGLLLEDRELEYFAKHDDFSDQQSFDDFLLTVIEGRKTETK